MQVEVHDRLVLPTEALMIHCSGWEKVPNVQSVYRPVSRRSARPAWMYSRENVTRAWQWVKPRHDDASLDAVKAE
jgi:hypothetical protein